MGLVKTADRANFLIRHLAEFGGGPETDCVRYTLSELASVPRHAGGSRRSFTYICMLHALHAHSASCSCPPESSCCSQTIILRRPLSQEAPRLGSRLNFWRPQDTLTEDFMIDII